MKTRRQEPPGRGGGDRTKTGRDRKEAPKKSDPRPPRSDRQHKRSDESPPVKRGSDRSRSPQGRKSEPTDGAVGTGGRNRGRPGDRRRERTAHVDAPVLARAGRELLYGRNAVMEALHGRRRIERLFVAEGVREDDRLRALMTLASSRGAEIDRLPRLMLDDAIRGANHQGVALEAEAYRYTSIDELLDLPGAMLVLDHLQDPQNVGTLLRAAETAGVAGVVIAADRAAEVTPAVVNASAGAVEHLRIATVPNLVQAIEAMKRRGRWVAGLDTGPGATDLFATDVPTPVALVVGAEGAGLGANLRKHCDLLLALPVRGRVASLNAATAGAIALYELLRRETLDQPR